MGGHWYKARSGPLPPPRLPKSLKKRRPPRGRVARVTDRAHTPTHTHPTVWPLRPRETASQSGECAMVAANINRLRNGFERSIKIITLPKTNTLAKDKKLAFWDGYGSTSLILKLLEAARMSLSGENVFWTDCFR